MADTFIHRLSPSGPFLEDSDSGDPLLVGPGTPGLVWRGSGNSSTPSITTAQPPGGLSSLPVNVQAGKSYWVSGNAQVQGVGADGNVVLDFFATNSSGTDQLNWTATDGTVMSAITVAVVNAEDQQVAIPFGFVWRPTEDYTAVNFTALGPTGSVLNSAACFLTVTEFVT